MGLCGPLRVPGWLWGTLGEQRQDPTARPAQKNTVSVRLHMCPSQACSHIWVHVPMSTCLCAPNVSVICVHLLSMCVWEQTQLCVYMHLCAHPWACIHFSHCAPRPTSVSLCIQCACPPMALYTHACVNACYVDRAPTQELATFFWKGQEIK